MPKRFAKHVNTLPQSSWLIHGDHKADPQCGCEVIVNDITFLVDKVVLRKESAENQMSYLTWLYRMSRDGYVGEKIYNEYVEVVFPKYIANDSMNKMLYWQDFNSLYSSKVNKSELPNYVHKMLALSELYKGRDFKKENVIEALQQLNEDKKKDIFLFLQRMLLQGDDDERKVRKYLGQEMAIKSSKKLRILREFVYRVNLLYTSGQALRPMQEIISYEDGEDRYHIPHLLNLAKAYPLEGAWLAGIIVPECEEVKALNINKVRAISSPNIQVLPAQRVGRLSKGRRMHPIRALKGQLVIQIGKHIKRQQLKVLNKFFPPTSTSDSRHMTTKLASVVSHLLWPSNDNGFRLYPNAKEAIEAINNILKHIAVGTNNTITTAAIIMCLAHKHGNLCLQEIVQRDILMYNEDTQRKILKAYSTAIRNTATLPNGTIISDEQTTALAYWELAYGRSEMLSDWVKEIEHRCTATKHIKSLPIRHKEFSFQWREGDCHALGSPIADAEFEDRLTKHIEIIVRDLLPERCTQESWTTFLMRRQEWAASGSASGATIELDKTSSLYRKFAEEAKGKSFSAKPQVKVGKRGWLESHSLSELKNALFRKKPEEDATASEKMENGKARAIYGVGIQHYCINTYATKGLEERMHKVKGLEKGLSGLESYKAELKKARMTADSSLECTMLDWADFNIHHTPSVQRLLFLTIAKVGKARGAHKDWVAANEWIAEGKMNMTCRFPGENKKRKVVQGMFSGTRSTDLINTILNLAYYRVAKDLVKRDFYLTPIAEYDVHQGDDFWLSNKCRHIAAAIYYYMNNMNFVFQPSKQMFGKGRGEFLRVLYSKGNAYGYAFRQVVNYLQRPIQNDLPMNAQAWAQTLAESFSRFSRRGFSIGGVNWMYDDAVSFWLKVKANKDDKKPIAIPNSIVAAPISSGGLGLLRPGYFIVDSPRFDAMPVTNFAEQLGDHKLPSHMTDDWIKFISTKLPANSRQIDVDAIKRSLIANNYADVCSQALDNKSARKMKNKTALWLNNQKARIAGFSCVKDYEATDITKHAKRIGLYQSLRYKDNPIVHKHGVYRENVRHALFNDVVLSRSQISTLSKTLKGVMNSSIFKSVEITAQAFSINDQAALAWILAQISENKTFSRNDIQTLRSMTLPKNKYWFEVLQTEVFGAFFNVSHGLSSAPLLEAISQINSLHCACGVNVTHTSTRSWDKVRSSQIRKCVNMIIDLHSRLPQILY